MIKKLAHRVGREYTRRLTRSEFQTQRFTAINERPIEFRFVFDHLTALQPITVLDVGTGTTALPHLMSNCGFVVTATDNVRDYWSGDMFNRHFHIVNDDIRQTGLTTTFDLITCISTLEHIPEHRKAMSNIFRLLNPGGHLILTCPYNEWQYSENVYEAPQSLYGKGSTYVCQSYSRSQLDTWLTENNGTLVFQEYWRCFTGTLWTFGERVRPPAKVTRDDTHQLSCMLLQKK